MVDGLPYRRLASVIYPDGTEVTQKYGPAGGIDSAVGRLKAMQISGKSQDFVQYAYMGLGSTVVVDYPEPDVRLDRSVEYNGNQRKGEYPGWDRFGRPVAQRWIDGDGFERSSISSDAWPPIPQIVELAYAHDKRGNVVQRRDDRPGLQWPDRHEVLEYDGLHRLVEAKRGEPQQGGGGFIYEPSSQQWELDVLGNWLSVSGEADVTGAYQETELREHNAANELTQRTFDALAPPAPLEFDEAGNLILQRLPFTSTDVTYVHDGWNRLTEVRYNNVLRASFSYNALHQRVAKTADTTLNGTIDQRRVMFYSANWQLLEEHIDTAFSGSFTPDRKAQYFWGARGMDDIILRRVNASFAGPYNEFFYHLTDTQFSTVCVIDHNANVLERVSYDAYGRARHHRATDLTGDGASTRDDWAIVQARLGLTNGAGGVADLNRDGVVDAQDAAMFAADAGPALAAGLISHPSIGNPLGYGGYHFNAELQIYLARHRYYDPVLGRWLTRDPAGYVDGMNLYLYGLGSPFVFVDPMGLWGFGPIGNWCARQMGFKDANQAVELTAVAVAEMAADGIVAGIESAVTSRIEKDIAFASKVAAIEQNAIGSEITPTGVVVTALAESTGIQRVAEGTAGIDMASNTLLDGIERASRILTGTGEALLLTSVAGKGASALAGTTRTVTRGGETVYRVWGDGAEAFGRSWTTINPSSVGSYRNAAGLPSQNSGRFVSEGILQNTNGVIRRPASPLHGNSGGLPEIIVPNPSSQIHLRNVSGANPPF